LYSERQFQHGYPLIWEWKDVADSLKVWLVLWIGEHAPGIFSFGHVFGNVGDSTKH
jgi:hypothetical protein